MTKSIPLSQGKIVLVSDEDFDGLNKHKWFYDPKGYAARNMSRLANNRHIIYMHREIMGFPEGMEIDHANGDGLDNRRENLRLATSTENKRNARVRKNNISGYKGVYFDKRRSLYSARIVVDYKSIWLGHFRTAQEAAIAYNNAALENFGEFSRLNKIGE